MTIPRPEVPNVTFAGEKALMLEPLGDSLRPFGISNQVRSGVSSRPQQVAALDDGERHSAPEEGRARYLPTTQNVTMQMKRSILREQDFHK